MERKQPLSRTGHFDHSYRRLGPAYSADIAPTPVQSPQWIGWNAELANALGWPEHWCQSELALSALAGNVLLDGSAPVATVYAGHQFGSYNPQLGDGRAILLGEWLAPDGERFDIQLKGAGPTPYSRGGDGRSPIGPVVREFLISEAMHALGVPTTRALAAVATGESVYRQHPEPGAVLTRVARSHLRIGTVQYFAMSQGGDGVAELVEYVTERHYPEALAQARAEDSSTAPGKVLLSEACKSLAALVAQWQSIGFIHGVLNTDNMLLCGDTVDYGPCAFMDNHDPAKVFSSIDTQGRYAYQNQPGIVHWNLSVLAQCLLPVLDSNEDNALAFAQRLIDDFPRQFTDIQAGLMGAKFGLDAVNARDRTLMDDFLNTLHRDELDFTLAFRWLTEHASDTVDHTPLPELFTASDALKQWAEQWRARYQQQPEDSGARLQRMQSVNPVVIPRNHLIADAIAETERGNNARLAELQQRWQSPTTWTADDLDFAARPRPEQIVQRTFCGT